VPRPWSDPAYAACHAGRPALSYGDHHHHDARTSGLDRWLAESPTEGPFHALREVAPLPPEGQPVAGGPQTGARAVPSDAAATYDEESIRGTNLARL